MQSIAPPLRRRHRRRHHYAAAAAASPPSRCEGAQRVPAGTEGAVLRLCVTCGVTQRRARARVVRLQIFFTPVYCQSRRRRL